MERVVPPGGWRQWFEVLPRPWNEEQDVTVLVVPNDWTVRPAKTTDEKFHIIVAVSPQEKVRGLQVIHSDYGKYHEQRELFADYAVRMVQPEYVGPLSALPQSALMDEGMSVYIYRKQQMWKSPIDLQKVKFPEVANA